MIQRALLTLAMAGALSSCAASPQAAQHTAPPPITDRLVADDFQRAIASSEVQLAAPAADCTRACELVDAICTLSDRICKLVPAAGDDLERTDLTRQCADATTRCERARTRIAPRCGCAPPPQHPDGGVPANRGQ